MENEGDNSDEADSVEVDHPSGNIDEEEEKYQKKMKECRSYLPLIQAMLQKCNKDYDDPYSANCAHKLQELYNIFANKKRRLAYPVLLKCEKVLKKLAKKLKVSKKQETRKDDASPSTSEGSVINKNQPPKIDDTKPQATTVTNTISKQDGTETSNSVNKTTSDLKRERPSTSIDVSNIAMNDSQNHTKTSGKSLFKTNSNITKSNSASSSTFSTGSLNKKLYEKCNIAQSKKNEDDKIFKKPEPIFINKNVTEDENLDISKHMLKSTTETYFTPTKSTICRTIQPIISDNHSFGIKRNPQVNLDLPKPHTIVRPFEVPKLYSGHPFESRPRYMAPTNAGPRFMAPGNPRVRFMAPGNARPRFMVPGDLRLKLMSPGDPRLKHIGRDPRPRLTRPNTNRWLPDNSRDHVNEVEDLRSKLIKKRESYSTPPSVEYEELRIVTYKGSPPSEDTPDPVEKGSKDEVSTSKKETKKKHDKKSSKSVMPTIPTSPIE